jgi:MFS family permease
VTGAIDRVAVPGWRELFAPGRGRIAVGLVLMEFLVAIQVLVEVAVLPAIVAEFGGVRLLGVALSASQVATVVVLPFTPRLVRRWGLRPIFYVSVGVFLAGGALLVTAPTSLVFVSGVVLEGVGTGAQYVLLLAILTRSFALRLRPRMYAVLAAAWALPGMLGPAYGGLLASTLGWRWAFALILPLVLPAVWMLRPALRETAAADGGRDVGDDLASASTLVTFGACMVVLLALFTLGSGWIVLVGVVALVGALVMLRRLLPAGTLVARHGLPAVVASGFLVNAAYFSVEGFLPAFLTGVIGLPLTVAGLVVTCGVLAWVAGSWAQARLTGVWPLRRIAMWGEAVLLLGVLGVLIGVASTFAPLVYGSWGLAGLGIGMAYPAIGVLATDLATPGREVVALSQYQLGEVLGSGVGPGLVGLAVTMSAATGLGLQDGLLIGFAGTCMVVLTGLGAARRLP